MKPHFSLVHVDACFHVCPRMHGAHERVGNRRFGRMGVIGTVVVCDQTAQACR